MSKRAIFETADGAFVTLSRGVLTVERGGVTETFAVVPTPSNQIGERSISFQIAVRNPETGVCEHKTRTFEIAKWAPQLRAEARKA